MKKCPLCQMTVDAEHECPYCYTTLTYEPFCDEEKEHIVWNRYYFIYLAKNCWFSVLCCMIGIVKFFIDRSINELFIIAIFLSLLSLLISVFQRSFTKGITWKYSESHAPFKAGMWKYQLGSAAILLFLFC